MYVTITYMRKAIIGYIAGIVDGEGTINIIHQKQPGKSNPRIHRLYVGIGTTNQESMQFIVNQLGFGYLRNKGSYPSRNGRKILYQIDFFGPPALQLLILIKKYLIIKKQQAEIGIKFQKELSRVRHQWQKNRIWIMPLCQKIRELNRFSGHSRPQRVPCPYKPQLVTIWNKGITNKQ